MNATLAEVAGFRISIGLAAAFFSVVVLLLFVTWWMLDRKKRTGQSIFVRQVVNGFGFGLLPALALWKIFEGINTPDAGRTVLEQLPQLPWLTAEGRYLPCRIEMAAGLACFILICLWLILRKRFFPDNGDLLVITMCLWASIRMVTETFREEPHGFYLYLSCAVLLLSMLQWTVRRGKILRTPVRTAADWVAAAACTAMILLTYTGVVDLRSEIAAFAVITGCTALELLLILIVGGDLRGSIEKAGNAAPPPANYA